MNYTIYELKPNLSLRALRPVEESKSPKDIIKEYFESNIKHPGTFLLVINDKKPYLFKVETELKLVV